MEPRYYQSSAIEGLRGSLMVGNRRVIHHAPTGSGKTATSSWIISAAHEKGSKVLFLANRRELIFQAVETLEKFGIDCAIIMAGEEHDLSKQVQVASMQTYVRRMTIEDDLRFNKWWHDADLVIVDECHSSISPSWQKILQSYDTKVCVIGLTATPCRGDGRGLGEFYEEIISTVTITELIEQGFLVPIRYFAPYTPDMAGVKTVRGDWDQKEAAKRVNKPKLIGDIYKNWSIICPDRPTIFFAQNVQHSIAITHEFNSKGIDAAHIDARTPKEERQRILDDLKRGRVQVISNYGILTEGFDFPAASCIGIARPTKILGLYIQMGGRGLRPSPGKSDCIILDFAGCLETHGYLEEERTWTLDGKKKAWQEATNKKTTEKKMLKCGACHHVFSGTGTCPNCGSETIRYGKKVEVAEGELKEVKKTFSMAEKRLYLGMLKYYVTSKGMNPKAVNAKYKARFGVWPDHSIKNVEPVKPDEAFVNRMVHENIKYAKRKRY